MRRMAHTMCTVFGQTGHLGMVPGKGFTAPAKCRLGEMRNNGGL